MKITKRQLRRIIYEVAAREPANPDEIARSLNSAASGPGAGSTFLELTFAAIAKGDLKKAASVMMDMMWIDDTWPEDDQALEDALAGVDPEDYATNIEDQLAGIGADWLTTYRQSGHTTEEGMEKEKASWRK